jgi:phosphatidylserine/phosphatidylglycerophosphate/cardiolipin synthase-like enzyme
MQLVNNKVAFDSIIQHIDHAKESIEIRMFEWNADSIGDTIARKLIQKANSGLKIVIFKDY